MNKYVKHIRTHSAGTYYNRSRGGHDTKQKFGSKGIAKSRTPKFDCFKGIDFSHILKGKGDPTSQSNLRNSADNDFLKALTNINTKQLSQSQK